MVTFRDRRDAGRQLAVALDRLREPMSSCSGSPAVGSWSATRWPLGLGAPLDVIVVRKLGLPEQPELAMGAVGEGDVRVLNPEVVRSSGVSAAEVREVETAERAELEDRSGASARCVPGWTSWVAPPSSSTTASRPAPPPGRPAWSPALSVPPPSCWPCRSGRPRRWPTSPGSPTTW